MFANKSIFHACCVSLMVVFLLAGIGPVLAAPLPGSLATALNPSPPAQTVKLIFIHHSTGENLLRNDYGRLGQALATNNYFTSDTNYGWGPNSIGDRTDIPNWTEWFRSADTTAYMNALFNESGQNSSYTRLPTDPGGENEIVLFKSCFPNSNLEGNPTDPPDPSGGLTVGHAKYVYNEILKYFPAHPDKLFVVITAPPVTDATYAVNARAFNNWLLNEWLVSNHYSFSNVAVFDFYNVLTAAGAHHRYRNGSIEHIVTTGNTLGYPSGDDHPSVAGSRKAVNEFLPLLNIFYNRWKAEDIPQIGNFYSDAAQDGWILESTETSNAGGTLNSTAATLNLGDDAGRKQYRGMLSFNTGANLPDNAVITKVTLKVKKQGITGGGNPVTIFQGFMVDIKKGTFGTEALQASDFQTAANKTYGPFMTSLSGGWYSINLTYGKAYINKLSTPSGLTQIRLHFQKDDNDDNSADFLKFYSGDYATASARPKLVIEYYVP